VKKEYPETLRMLPYGVLDCRLNGRSVAIEELSKAHVTVRLFEMEQPEMVAFSVYSLKENRFLDFGPYEVSCVDCEQVSYATYLTLEPQGPGFSEVTECVLAELLRFIRCRQEGEANEFSKELCGYPAEGDTVFSATYEEWCRKQPMEQVKEKLSELQLEFAVSLDRAKLWEKLQKKSIKSEILPGKHLSRVYIGNAYCARLFPSWEQLEAMLKSAKELGLLVTIVRSWLREESIGQESEFLHKLAKACKGWKVSPELEINDWGTLQLLKEEGLSGAFQLTYGRLLNKRRRDPRQVYKIGAEELYRQQAENSLEDEEYRMFLEKQGFSRIEAECCGYPAVVPCRGTSLHLPLYQTNTSQFCTTAAYWAHADRGKQSDDLCGRACEQLVFLYPDHLHTVGRYNSIFAFDTSLATTDVLLWYRQNGVDRVVLNWEEI